MEEEVSLRFWLDAGDGQEREYEVVGSFSWDEKDYLALIPMEGGDGGVQLLGFHAGPEDEVILDPIEDDEEYAEAAEVFEDLFNGWIDREEYSLDGEEEAVDAQPLSEEEGLAGEDSVEEGTYE